MTKRYTYKPRLMAYKVREGLRVAPVVVLTGARQTGKTTLLKNEPPFSRFQYYSLDDPDVLAIAKEHPKELIGGHTSLVLDEIQKAPEILTHVKLAVDENRERRFILSGSANLLLMKNVSESLAGRAIYFNLLPFSLHEYLGRDTPHWLCEAAKKENLSSQEVLELIQNESHPVPGDLDNLLFRGFMPPVVELSSPSQVAMWWKGYVATYLERDLRDFARIFEVVSFHRFMEMLAARNAGILNQNQVARDAGISGATASRYTGLLEASGLFYKLRPFFTNISKRLIKTPKAYYLDTGLVCNLAGFRDPRGVPHQFKGGLFETFLLQNLLVWASYLDGEPYYFRTLGGRETEVDFVLEIGGKLFCFECKYKENITPKDASSLLKMREILKGKREIHLMAVIHSGDRFDTLPGGVLALPWWAI